MVVLNQAEEFAVLSQISVDVSKFIVCLRGNYFGFLFVYSSSFKPDLVSIVTQSLTVEATLSAVMNWIIFVRNIPSY